MGNLHQQVAAQEISDQLMLLEHSPVITYTTQHGHKNIHAENKILSQANIELTHADRGGDVTFHGPGQLVGYPIFKLKSKKIGDFVRTLEKALFKSVQALGVKNSLIIPGFTGIWIKNLSTKKINLKKLIAIGIRVQNNVTKHGFAFNISINHQKFTQFITPCGLKDRGVISLKEAMSDHGLELPCYSDIVTIVTQSIAGEFQKSLRSTEYGRKYHHAPAG